MGSRGKEGSSKVALKPSTEEIPSGQLHDKQKTLQWAFFWKKNPGKGKGSLDTSQFTIQDRNVGKRPLRKRLRGEKKGKRGKFFENKTPAREKKA